ncbi:TetR/AcrR family transcriptional regulator [Aureispira anguillae]|uniref:TetR/AcrR family transcriptional regulator n=1 Tax=Aureispira anguillae TaxID=2864201 RepID=A0A915YKC0_9BACT|nr:TetR/AcrR family transcriptional regulator [Aureispira anguillae]BDS14795.1 TetR/AcrR family transcriptional regulator [Aureispira anguillae]
MNHVDELTKILDASEILFRKYGIRSVTMADIARDLGMSKKTLYLYIENKHDLVSKVMKRHIIQDQDMCCRIQKESENALDELLKVSLYVQQQVKEINPSLIFDLQKYHRPIWEMMDNFHRKDIVHMVENNLRGGVEEGVYRDNLNVELVSRLYVSLMLTLSDNELFPVTQFPTHVLHKEFIRYHICGIVSDKGRIQLREMLDSLDPTGEIY